MLYPLSSDGGVEVYGDKFGEMLFFKGCVQRYCYYAFGDSQNVKNDSQKYF